MNKVKLGEILDIKRGTSLSGKYYSEKGDKIRLTLGNFDYPGHGFKENSSKKDIYFTGNIANDFVLKKGDIITPLTEQVAGLLGETARIPKDQIYIQSGDIGLVIPKDNVLAKSFAYYLISSPIIKKQLSAAAQQTKIRHTSPEKIKNCVAWIPDIQQQKKIAKLLDSVNLKIEHNNTIIAKLEEMAKTLYDYWFIQFDFPDINGKPYKTNGGKLIWNSEIKKEIPDTWKSMSLGDFIKNYDSKRIPLSGKQRASRKGNYQYYGATGVMDYIDDYIFDGQYVLLAEDGSVENSNGYVIVQFIWGKTWVNNHAHVIQPINDSDIDFLFQLLNTVPARKITTGSVQKKVNQENLNGFIFAKPTDDLLNKFSNILIPIRKKIILLHDENRELKQLCDWLLPMLMNGQVTIT